MKTMTTVNQIRFLKVSPRGFANEIIYFAVPAGLADEAAAEFEHRFADSPRTSGYAEWTKDSDARIPGVAIDWADRAFVGI